MAKDMDINNTRRADEVSKVIAEKMNESNQYWIKRAEKKKMLTGLKKTISKKICF
jgi:hypothetical protein